jgi:hypothetical protein
MKAMIHIIFWVLMIVSALCKMNYTKFAGAKPPLHVTMFDRTLSRMNEYFFVLLIFVAEINMMH